MHVDLLVILSGIVIAGGSAARYALLSNRAARFLYEQENGLWQSLGKPVGYFWVPPELRGPSVAQIYENRARLDDALRDTARLSSSETTRLTVDRYMKIGRHCRLSFVAGVCVVLAGVLVGLVS